MLVDGLLGQPNGARAVEHDGRAWQCAAQRPLVAPERIERGGADPRAPVRPALGQPVGDHLAGASLDHIQQLGRAPAAGSTSTSPVTNRVELVAEAARNAVSSKPSTVTVVCSHWASSRCWPYSR